MAKKKPTPPNKSPKPEKTVAPQKLPIPPDAKSAGQAVEVFRAWIIDGEFQCVLHPTIWKDNPEVWGSVFADAAIHTANALGEELGTDPQAILKTIVAGFLNEARKTGVIREGEFVDWDEE